MAESSNLLSVSEAAGFLKVSEHTIRVWERQGRFPAVRLGSRVLFDRADLERFIEASRAGGKDK